MKKTFLLLAALLVGATSANAQRFISTDALPVNKVVGAKDAGINTIIKKQAENLSKDFTYGDPVMTVSFKTTDVNYAFTNLPGHSAGDLQGRFNRYDTTAATTAILQSSYNDWVYFYYDNFGSYAWFSNRLGEKMGDGFALISPMDKFYADGEQNNKVYNSAIKCTDGFATTGFNTVDVVFNQIVRRFNSDRYYVDYSTDPTFPALGYDSIEFNIRGIEVAVNDYGAWTKRVTLPVAQSVGKDVLYIRLRYVCPPRESAFEQGQPSSYFWAVDEINVFDGPAQRIDEVSSAHYYATYGIVPQGMKMDTLNYRVIIENTGGDTLFNAIVEEKYNTAPALEFSPITFVGDLGYTSRSSAPYNVTTATRQDTVFDGTSIDEINLVRSVSVWAETGRLFTQEAGIYGLSGSVKYHQTSDGEVYDSKELRDSLYYRVTPMPEATSANSATWACDMDVLIKSAAWTGGMVGQNTYSDYTTAAFEPGYTVCNRFITPTDLPEGTYYAKGVEVVAAADSCIAGARIMASMKKYIDIAETYEEVIVPFLTSNNEEVASDVYTVGETDLNNGLFAAGGSIATDFTSINLPFTQSNILLEPGNWYYACFKIIDNNDGASKFVVASDNSDIITSFKEIDRWSKIVAAPGAETFEDASWGKLYGQLAKGNAPMVRLRVSMNPLSINDVNNEIPSFNLNAYPNPAKTETTIEYTLNTNSNVVVTVTDIMGREIVKLNQGSRSANSVNRVALNTANMNNGTYFYTINANGIKETKKLVINK
ncbi:MAG: T9SS type A sorting domain-containing protein [Bacteroidales bacterium]